MNDKEILELIKNKTFNEGGKEKLACGSAWELSLKEDVSMKKIGELCDSNSIKICLCSLGCFE